MIVSTLLWGFTFLSLSFGYLQESLRGAVIEEADLWLECFHRYQLDQDYLPSCEYINCDNLISYDGVDNSYEICQNIQSKIRKNIKRDHDSNFQEVFWSYGKTFQQIVKSWSPPEKTRVVDGKVYERIGDQDVRTIYPRASNLIGGPPGTPGSPGSSHPGNSTSLTAWEPVSDIIGQNETKNYQFNVNTTSTGLSSFYHILVFLSGNICTLPKSIGSTSQLTVYYGFDPQLFTNFSNASYSHAYFQEGYMKGLATHTIPANPNDTFVTLYVKVQAPATQNTTDVWDYEFGISQDDLVYQWDNKTWISVVDTDDKSALLITGNFTSVRSLNLPNPNTTAKNLYEVYIYPDNNEKSYFRGLSNSWCAIRKGPAVLSSVTDMDVTFTNRSGSLRQQFYVDNLNKSTSYIGYALKSSSGGSDGGTVFKKIKFSTKNDDACQLIYNLQFCSDVAYSVPAKGSGESYELAKVYDNNTSTLYQNFQRALNQIACETEPDAIYSPLTSCDKCAASYKSWLCAVTIPRCTTENRSEYVYRPKNSSRHPYINDNIQPSPYYEILPCFNSCYAIVRDCPADLGFGCPSNISYVTKSTYYWDMGLDYLTCNFVGRVASENWATTLVFNRLLHCLCLVLLMFLLI